MGSNPKKKRSLLKSLFILLVLLLLACLAAAAYFPGLLFLSLDDPASIVRSGILSGDTINIALLGFDASAARGESSLYRPDTILIAAFDFRAAEIRMVSIPRDSYVKINGQDTFDKINHSYMYGYYSAREGEDPDQKGISTTLLTIGDFLGGVPLHGYIRVDMDGAAAIVDSVGGVYIDVEEDFRSDYGRGSVTIEKGYQRLDGSKFLHYVRNRADYLGGERGRTIRQQQALAALLDQQKSLRGLVRTPALFMAVNKHVESDLNFLQLTALGLTGLRAGAKTAGTYVFSGRGQLSYRGGQNIYYLVIDEENRVATIKTVFGIDIAKGEQISLPGPQVSEPEQIVEEVPVEPVPEEPPAEPEPEPEPDPEPDPDPEPEQDPEPDPDPEQEPEDEAESGQEAGG